MLDVSGLCHVARATGAAAQRCAPQASYDEGFGRVHAPYRRLLVLHCILYGCKAARHRTLLHSGSLLSVMLAYTAVAGEHACDKLASHAAITRDSVRAVMLMCSGKKRV